MEPKTMELVAVDRKGTEALAAERMRSWPHELATREEGSARQSAPRLPSAFVVIALVLPRRLYKEDLGDAMETLAALENAGAPRWQWWLKICSTYLWLLVNVVRELTSVLHGKGTSSKS